MNIVVLISGNGSNLQAIIDACKTNKIKGTVRAVFSNKADAFGLERARQAGIATHTLITSAFDSREAYDRELIHEIDMYAPDVVVLAGFMRILSPAFVSHYAGRLLNIHPSLLPKYPGLHTHRQALENGDEEHVHRCISSPMNWTVARLFYRRKSRYLLVIRKMTSPPACKPRNTLFIHW